MWRDPEVGKSQREPAQIFFTPLLSWLSSMTDFVLVGPQQAMQHMIPMCFLLPFALRKSLKPSMHCGVYGTNSGYR